MIPRTGRTLLATAVLCGGAVSRAHAQHPANPDTITNREVRCASCAGVPPLTLGEKARFYSDRTFSVRTLLGASYAAGIAQWRKTPEEWGSGISGYGRRDAAAYGGAVIRHTTEFAVGALLHEDPRFEPSARDGFAARTTDALHNTVFVRTDDGNRRFAWSRVAASLATGFAVNSWEPKRLHSTHHAVMLSLAGVASYATGDVMREFTPDIKHYLLHKLGIADRM
jgi:hypothetical protein